ncbi:MAG: RNA pseudouridine synthase, partial [Chlamydiales bacterium]|nr:RNA pseudouridine synthase [Chlamydiales bacterium]
HSVVLHKLLQSIAHENQKRQLFFRLSKRTTCLGVKIAKISKIRFHTISLSRLQEMMRERKIKKTYITICEGTVLPQEGTLEHNLVHDDYKATVAKDGKPSTLHYKVVGDTHGHSIILVDLVTGRYHQIRAQFQAIGHPVLGDKKYKSHHSFYKDIIALHHKTMVFEHPVTHVLMEISAPEPHYWLESTKKRQI